MKTQLENALDAVKRGLKVFPCVPRTKSPAVEHGVLEATTDVEQIRKWWKSNPHFNPAVTGGIIVDCDSGLSSLQDALNFALLNNLPRTLIVRTGRRTSYGAQFHFTGEAGNGNYVANGVSGEIRGHHEYGMAPGAIHPVTGERYEIALDLPRAGWVPGLLDEFRTSHKSKFDGESKPSTLFNARETFFRLLYKAAHARQGERHHQAHRVTWFAARAFLAGVFREIKLIDGLVILPEVTMAEVKCMIFAAVNPLYSKHERDIAHMLRDSWASGLEAGKLELELCHEDAAILRTLSDDMRFQHAWDADVSDFSCAVDAKEYMLAALTAGGASDAVRILRASQIFEAVGYQIQGELQVAQIMSEGGN